MMGAEVAVMLFEDEGRNERRNACGPYKMKKDKGMDSLLELQKESSPSETSILAL